MSVETQHEVERLKEREDVQTALENTTHGKPRRKVECPTGDRVRLFAYAAAFVAFALVYYLVRFRAFGMETPYRPLMLRAALGAVLLAFTLSLTKLVEIYAVNRVRDVASRYNLSRALKLVTGLAVIAIVLSVVFENWYTAVVSFGLLSLILGFALQTPITSLLGWVYLLARSPYRVGDRIRIGALKGDVIDVGYFDTTLWEFGGDYLSTDHPSGRLIRFPNANVLSEAVINYSWPLFPYIWNEIKFQIAYQSDLAVVAGTMQRVVEEELGEDMMDRVGVYRELLAETAVDHLEVQERPVVFFRVGENTWVEAIVRYLVHPREAGRVKSRLIPKLLAELNASPEAVLFPKADMR
jgi:small-conductance mechanosensitive channel